MPSVVIKLNTYITYNANHKMYSLFNKLVRNGTGQ